MSLLLGLTNQHFSRYFRSMKFRSFVLTLGVLWCSLVFGGGIQTKQGQLTELNQILLELETHYGMWAFKEETLGITPELLREKYTRLIENAQTLEEAAAGSAPQREVLPVEEFEQLMIALINELRDGHANITRAVADKLTIGVQAAAIDGRLFVTGFQKKFYVESTTHPLRVGDEIIAIDGVPVQQVAEGLMPYVWGATHVSTFHNALEAVLNRHHMFQRKLPEGQHVRVRFRRPGTPTAATRANPANKVEDLEFEGDYRWVNVDSYSELRALFPDLAPREKRKPGPYVFGGRGTDSYFWEGMKRQGLSRGSVIDVGRILNSQIEDAKKPHSEFARYKRLQPTERVRAWVVESEGKRIGVLRIPSYSPGDVVAEVRWLSQVVPMMEHMTDALIVDHLHNGGGSVYEVVQLLRLFAKEPLPSTAIDMRLSKQLLGLLEAYASTEELTPEQVEAGLLLGLVREDPLAVLDEVEGASSSEEEDPFLRETQNFSRAHLNRERIREMRAQFERGELQTGLTSYMENVEDFRPGRVGRTIGRADYIYSKPVLVINDQRSASGGDFFAAFMQASKRALVLGETSAGLGGPVFRSMRSSGAELSMRCTMGVCYRVDGLPVENIGVVPDLERWVEPSDLRDDFKAYTKEVLQVARWLAEGKTQDDVRVAYREARQKALKLSEAAQSLEVLAHSVSVQENVTTEDLFALYELVASTPSLKREDWVRLRLPLPKELLRKDVMLASVGTLGAARERLQMLQRLPVYQEGGEHAALRPLVDRLSEALARLPDGTRFEACVQAFEPRVKLLF